MSKRMMDQKGFTLIELLLVVVVMGLMLAVIVPRGQRATVDTKYTLVRQAAAELGSFGNDWVEQQMNAQMETSSSTMDDYLVTLADDAGKTAQTWAAKAAAQATGFYAYTASVNSNWVAPDHNVLGRNGAANAVPENSVSAIVPPEKTPRNPFNGASYFATSINDQVTPGALQLATAADDDSTWHYYAFVFYGTDNTDSVPGTPDQTVFYAGMGDATAVAMLRNGVFMSRAK